MRSHTVQHPLGLPEMRICGVLRLLQGEGEEEFQRSGVILIFMFVNLARAMTLSQPHCTIRSHRKSVQVVGSGPVGVHHAALPCWRLE